MDMLAPDLRIVWQMFSLAFVCAGECVCVRACVNAHELVHPVVGIQVLQAPGAITDLSLLMLFISFRLFASSRLAARLSSPTFHTLHWN